MYSTEVLDYWDLDYRIPHNTWSYKILHLFYIFNIIRICIIGNFFGSSCPKNQGTPVLASSLCKIASSEGNQAIVCVYYILNCTEIKESRVFKNS